MTLGEWIIHLESGFEDYPIEQEHHGEVTRQDIKDLIEMLVELHQRRTTKNFPIPPDVINGLEGLAKKIYDNVEVCDMCVAFGWCGMNGGEVSKERCRNAIAKLLARSAGWRI